MPERITVPYRQSQKKHLVKRKEASTWKDLERELEDLNEEPRSKEDEQSQHNQGRQMQWEGHQMEYLYNYLSNNLAQWIQIRLRGCVINIQDLFDNVWRS